MKRKELIVLNIGGNAEIRILFFFINSAVPVEIEIKFLCGFEKDVELSERSVFTWQLWLV